MLVLALLYVASIGPYWNISPDSATYVGWARLLATGAGWHAMPPDPPLTSAVFAAVVRRFGDGYVALNALTPGLLAAALGMAFVLFNRRARRTTAVLAILVAAASTALYRADTQLLSEPLYMLLSIAALLALDGSNQARDGSRRLEIVAGCLVVACVLTRTVGLSLVVAILAVEAGRLRQTQRIRMIPVVACLLAVAAIVAWDAGTAASYIGGWFRMFVVADPWTPNSPHRSAADLIATLRGHATALGSSGRILLNEWSTGRPALNIGAEVAATATVVWGLARSLRAGISVQNVYVSTYLVIVTMHMIGTGDDDSRYLVPVLPFIALYAVETIDSVRTLARPRLSQRIRGMLGLGLALGVAWYVGTGVAVAAGGAAESHSSPFGAYPIKRPSNYDIERIARWLRANTPATARIAAGQRDMIDVFTGRRGDDIVIGQTSQPTELIAEWVRRKIQYVIVDRTSHLGDSLTAIAQRYPQQFRLMTSLPRASLYALTPTRGRAERMER